MCCWVWDYHQMCLHWVSHVTWQYCARAVHTRAGTLRPCPEQDQAVDKNGNEVEILRESRCAECKKGNRRNHRRS